MVKKEEIKEIFKIRQGDTNKGDFGYVAIMGGCLNYSGAIKLANLSCSALRAGCGVSKLIIPKSLSNIVAPYLLEQTLFTIDDEESHMLFSKEQIDEALKKVKALAIGMGWGQGKDNHKILAYILENYEIPVIIDADGLNTLSSMDKEILTKSKCKIIVTPHLKEFERLTGIPIEEINKHKSEITKKFAQDNYVIVLLKGKITIITDGAEELQVDRGCAGMSTAGSGDVLSGILVGLLGYNEPNVKTIAAGAYLAGLAGELAEKETNDISMIASDTIKNIPNAINQIRNYSGEKHER